MLTFNVLLLACFAYVAFLFLVAFAVERMADRRRMSWLGSPLIYTLSLSVYCTAWTFYGAVGYAARSGLEFVTIYLGPTLVFVGWWVLLRKLVRIGKAQRITSVADMISSRYGKSRLLGALVTGLAVLATTPYIALQLQSIALSFDVFTAPVEGPAGNGVETAVWVAAGLALFTILFGTRKLDANERHAGVVTAIAVEAVVKLVALLAVGVFVVWFVADGIGDITTRIEASARPEWRIQADRWVGLTMLSAMAIIALPRMFQVLVVENADERHLTTAAWAFPMYLFAMSIFVLPIAVVGLEVLPPGLNPDLFVLKLPLALGQDGLAMLAFLGGFSAATSMVIVAAIALATMVSNQIVVPLWLARHGGTAPGDMRGVVLTARRIAIAVVLGLGYVYYRVTGGGAALAAIGLIAFVGMAQVMPAMLGGIFWRGATRRGAAAGLVTGFAVWLYALFLPSFGPDVLLPARLMAEGPLGIGWLRPQALFGVHGFDPLLHALFWSLLLNTAAFVIGSLSAAPGALERVQGVQFVNVFDLQPATRGWSQGAGEADDLLAMAQRILGTSEAQGFFRDTARAQGKVGYLPDATPDFLEQLERRLAGSVGSATAHAMIAQVVGRSFVSVEDLMAVASETAQIMEYSSQLEAKSEELARTARQLRTANDMLTKLSVQKDAFLSQISHELRTPMTSIRAFSEILKDAEGLNADTQRKYAGIIQDEAIRLTRLLDDLLDLSVLENGQVQLHLGEGHLGQMIDRALVSSNSIAPHREFVIDRDHARENIEIVTDTGRLAQVMINVLSNARKYCDATHPRIDIRVRRREGDMIEVDFADNGSGIPRKSRALIFEKFARLTDQAQAGGAGLGLAICREIMVNLGGSIDYVPGQGGAVFRLTFPRVLAPRRAWQDGAEAATEGNTSATPDAAE